MKQPYLVVKQEQGHSRNTGRPYVKITLIGIKDRKEYETYVEVGMRNYKYWTHIIEYPTRLFILTNLTVKKDNLITADSRPVIEHSCLEENSRDLLGPIEEFWRELDEIESATRFSQLFEVTSRNS